jgi:hypothetical protein
VAKITENIINNGSRKGGVAYRKSAISCGVSMASIGNNRRRHRKRDNTKPCASARQRQWRHEVTGSVRDAKAQSWRKINEKEKVINL